MAFSPTEAAFEGFRLTREQPRAVLWWIGGSLIYKLVMDALLAGLGGADMAAFQEALRNPAADMDAATSMGPGAVLFGLAAMPVVIVFGSLMACAAYRAVLTPGDARYGYFRLGADEWRMILLQLLLLMVFTGVFMTAITAGMGLLAAATGAGAGLGMVLGALAFALVAGALVFVAIRLSLAAPLTFVEKRISLRDAWAMTRGAFWPLLGAFIMTWTLAIVVEMLAAAIIVSIGAAITGSAGAATSAAMIDPGELADVFSPGHLAMAVGSAVVLGLQYAIVLATPAVAYRQLAPRRGITA